MPQLFGHEGEEIRMRFGLSSGFTLQGSYIMTNRDGKQYYLDTLAMEPVIEDHAANYTFHEVNGTDTIVINEEDIFWGAEGIEYYIDDPVRRFNALDVMLEISGTETNYPITFDENGRLTGIGGDGQTQVIFYLNP